MPERSPKTATAGKGAGYGFALLAAVLWGLIGPVARLAFSAGTGPLELAFWRAALAGTLFAGQVQLGRAPVLPRAMWPTAAAFGAAGVALFYASYHLAVEAGGAALAAILLYTAPAQVAVLSPLVLGEALTLRKGTAALVAVGGAALVIAGGGLPRAGDGLPAAALLWGLLSSLCYTGYYLFGRCYFRHHAASSIYAIAFPVGAGCLLGPAALEAGLFSAAAGIGPDVFSKPAAAWGALLWAGLASTYLAYRVHGEALRRLEATRVSVVTTLEPVVAAGTAYLAWGERLGPLGLLGALVVLGAALWAVLERGPSPSTDAPSPEENASSP